MAKYPETANNAELGEDGRQFAPSTPRNKDPILDLLRSRLGNSGRFLEIASGTGRVANLLTNGKKYLQNLPSSPYRWWRQ